VVGVLPPVDRFAEVFSPAVRIDYYWPINNDDLRGNVNTVAMIGRMKPGVTAAQAQADLSLAIDRLKQQHPERGKWYWANLMPLKDYVVGELRQPLIFLWAAAGLVFAIVGFNFGGLLLARGAAHRTELALRVALGASRGRIVRQLLTQSLVLVVSGSVLGAAVAFGLLRYLSMRSATEIPLLQSVRLDGAALGFTALLCAIMATVCGLLPALRLTRARDVQWHLKDTARGSAGGPRRSLTRSMLVVIEVALAGVLVVSAGLMVRSFINLLKVDLGFAPENVLAVRIDSLMPPEKNPAYIETILDRVRALPGVEQAGVTDCIPVERDRSWGAYPFNADNPKDQRWTGAHVRIVSPGSFAAMGTRIIAGRDFERGDGAGQQPVAIINRSMAELFWPGQNAIGRFFVSPIAEPRPRRVIGVVEDVYHSGPAVAPGNEMYFSLRQNAWEGSFDLLVRTRLKASAITPDLRRALHAADPALPVTMIRPLTALVDRTLSSRRLLASLVAGFAALALGLAALGLYGLISYTVAQQTKEIGIRMALGADAAAVRRAVVGRTMKLSLYGLVVGVMAAVAAGRLMKSLLFGVTADDPATYAVMIAVLLGCSFIAGYLPARRASRVDPVVALRAE
jgi:predicted permease